jgi:hypothetical protein
MVGLTSKPKVAAFVRIATLSAMSGVIACGDDAGGTSDGTSTSDTSPEGPTIGTFESSSEPTMTTYDTSPEGPESTAPYETSDTSPEGPTAPETTSEGSGDTTCATGCASSSGTDDTGTGTDDTGTDSGGSDSSGSESSESTGE